MFIGETRLNANSAAISPNHPRIGDLAVAAAPAGHSCGQVVMLRRLGHDSSFGT